MNLYIDVSEFLHNRYTTGIQRVVKELIYRANLLSQNVYIIYFNNHLQSYEYLSKNEVNEFVTNIKDFVLKSSKQINIFTAHSKNNIFFDLDSVWNNQYKRVELYKKLKDHNFLVYNFIYDLIPVLFPKLVKDATRNNFSSFLDAVCQYSDFIFFDSYSAKNDFLTYKQKRNMKREIPTKVVYLGSDFIHHKTFQNEYSSVLSKKYILFVGTIEPRKRHDLLVNVFERLYTKYPELHLVLIGTIGWKVEEFRKTLYNHPLKDINIHHLVKVDDSSLYYFYKNAFLVTYLSDYEGYGLPISESLQHSNITIVSDNSSMPEVGQLQSDYINNTEEELFNKIESYLENDELYNARKCFIKDSYRLNTWDNFFETIIKEIPCNGSKSFFDESL